MENDIVFDKETVMERLDNDVELLQELLGMLFSDVDQRIISIENSHAENDFEGIEKKAHSLKSALGNLGANKAHHYSYEIENAGRNSTENVLQDLIPKFKEAIAEFKTAVSEYL